MAMKFNDTFLRIIQADLATARIIPALMGEPGIGKTSFAQSLADKLDTKIFTIQANQLSEKADLTGVRTVPTPDGKSYTQVFFPHQTIHDVNEYAKANPDETPVLDIEEINRTDDDVTSALLSLSTERVCGNTKLEDNIRIIVTGNTKGNVNVLDSASLSRFAIYEMEADVEVFLDAMGNRLNSYVREVLVNNPNYIFIKPETTNDTYSVRAAQTQDSSQDDDDSVAGFDVDMFSSEQMLQFTTPRTIEGISNWLNQADDALLRELLGQTTSDNRTMLQTVLESHTGDTEFTAELAMTIMNSLSKPKNTASQGATIATPSKPSSYTHLESLGTNDEVDNYVASLSDEEAMKLFNYTMTAPNNKRNVAVIASLGSRLNALTDQDHMREFIQMLTSGYVHKANIDALETTRSPLYQSLTMYLDLAAPSA